MIELNDRAQAAINDVISAACKKLIDNINSFDDGGFCGSDAEEIFEALAILSKLDRKESKQNG